MAYSGNNKVPVRVEFEIITMEMVQSAITMVQLVTNK